MRTTELQMISRIEQGLRANKLPRDRSREANIFSILEYGNSYETRGTRLIRWLCDPQAEHGCAAFFVDKLFALSKAKRVDIPAPKPVNPEITQAFAEETLAERKRNDVVVVEETAFGERGKTLTIEHKTHAKEGKLSDGTLQRQGYFRITNEKFSPSAYDNYFIYLTPNGEPPFTPPEAAELKEFTSWSYVSYEQIWVLLEETLSLLDGLDNQGIYEDARFVIKHYISDLKFHVQNQSSDRKKYVCERILLNEQNWSLISDETTEVLVSLGLGMIGSEIKLLQDLKRDLLNIGTQFTDVADRLEDLQSGAKDHWNAWIAEFTGTGNHLKVLTRHIWTMFLEMQKSSPVLNKGVDVFVWMLDKHKDKTGHLNYPKEVQNSAKIMIQDLKKEIESDRTLSLDTQTKPDKIIHKDYPELSVSVTDGKGTRPAVVEFNGSGKHPKFSFKLQCKEFVARSEDMVSFLNGSSEFGVPGLKIIPKDWEKSLEKQKNKGSKESRCHVLTVDVSLSAQERAVNNASELIRKFATVVSRVNATGVNPRIALTV